MMYQNKYHNRALSDSSFLVTGGAGFIGSNIVEYLLKYGAKKVRVIDNLSTGSDDNINDFLSFPNYEFLNGDITDLDDCLKACQGIDMICHQAALGSVPRSIKNPIASSAVNVMGFLNILEAAKMKNIKRVVFASSSSVYGDSLELPKVENVVGHPISPYAASKVANEAFARAYSKVYDLEIIGLRYFNVFGPRQNPNGAYAAVIPKFIQAVINGEDVIIDGEGAQTRDFTFIENVVQANVKALTVDNLAAIGEIFNIAYGEHYSILELYNFIAKKLESNQKPIFGPARKGDVASSLANISMARNILGYEPQYSFYDGLSQTIKYFKTALQEG